MGVCRYFFSAGCQHHVWENVGGQDADQDKFNVDDSTAKSCALEVHETFMAGQAPRDVYDTCSWMPQSCDARSLERALTLACCVSGRPHHQATPKCAAPSTHTCGHWHCIDTHCVPCRGGVCGRIPAGVDGTYCRSIMPQDPCQGPAYATHGLFSHFSLRALAVGWVGWGHGRWLTRQRQKARRFHHLNSHRTKPNCL